MANDPRSILGRRRQAAAFLAAALLAAGCGGEAPSPADGAGQAGTVTVAPAEAYVAAGGRLAFTATVSGLAGTAVDWSVAEGPAGGAVTPEGVYTAPASPGSFRVVATSRGDATVSGSATVVVTAAPAGGPVPPLPVISRGVPVYSSGAYYGDAALNDASYATDWLSLTVPSWVALDLSGVPAAQRGLVVVAWYNSRTYGYDASVLDGPSYSLPAAYTLDVHAAPGGGAPPAAGDPGWITIASVTGNELSSRQHLVDLAGHGWLRMSITQASPRNVGSIPNTAALNLDVHDAHAGALDDWLFVGDSITASAWKPGSFAELVHAARPDYFPVAENAGIGYQTAASTAPRLAGWLAHFPGRFVALSLGTNDANGGLLGTAALDAFQASYASMIETVVAAGKIPVIPTIIASSSPAILANLPAMNARLDALRIAYPEVVRGPDLYAAFVDHPEWISDGIHPNDAGYAELRRQWAAAMLATVYPP